MEVSVGPLEWLFMGLLVYLVSAISTLWLPFSQSAEGGQGNIVCNFIFCTVNSVSTLLFTYFYFQKGGDESYTVDIKEIYNVHLAKEGDESNMKIIIGC